MFNFMEVFGMCPMSEFGEAQRRNLPSFDQVEENWGSQFGRSVHIVAYSSLVAHRLLFVVCLLFPKQVCLYWLANHLLFWWIFLFPVPVCAPNGVDEGVTFGGEKQVQNAHPTFWQYKFDFF